MDESLPVLHFEIGGQVKTVASPRMDAFAAFDGGSISGIDLDDIQPPSEMEGVSFNTNNNYQSHSMMTNGGGATKITDSPQMSSLKNRKTLSSSLVARRAIAGSHLGGGGVGLMKSVESVNSHTNLENVAPPSLLDELLDSMISVESITSEVASDPLQRTLCGQGEELSNYETALSDHEDTLTLISCKDLPLDGSSSNCSSNQSTPARKRRPGSITPKMKRELVRDRFKTYTVDSPELAVVVKTVEEKTEQIVPTTEESQAMNCSPEPKSPRLSAKQKRQGNRSRFLTQILDYSEMRIFEIAPKEGAQQMAEEQEDVEMKEEGEIKVKEEKAKDTEINQQAEKKTTGIKKTLLRFIKPVSGGSTSQGDSDDVFSPEAAPKSVRGRRKPEYVSPYRRPGSAGGGGGAGSGNQTPTGGKQVPSTKGAMIPTVGGQKKSPPGLISKLKQVASKKTSPTKSVTTKETNKDAVPPKELNRQGTFTKEEPSNENLPKVSSLPATPTKRSSSKLPLVGNGKAALIGTTTSSIPKNGGGVIRRQTSAPNGTVTGGGGEKKKSMLASPCSGKYSTGQLSERSASTVSIKSNGSTQGGKGTATQQQTVKGGQQQQEKKLPVSMPASRSNSTMGMGKTANGGAGTTSRISLYGRAKGLIPVTSSGKK